jgi:ABC-2 type transport system ATP-binding protein
MIEVERLTKYYGRQPAVKDVSFRVEPGEIVGFLGPNGAGKSTTMRILTCFSPASSGQARINGLDVRTDSLAIRSIVGYLPENVPLYPWMRVGKYLDFVARAKRVPADKRSAEIERVSIAVGISHVMGKLVRVLSKGYRQRVGFAQALLGDPAILILDEPTIGLDPRQIREVRELIKGFARNRTVILSTHILPEVSQVCDRVIIINNGSIIAEDSPSNLTTRHGKAARTKMVLRAPADRAKPVLGAIPGVISVQCPPAGDQGDLVVMIESTPKTDIRPVLSRTVVENGWDLLELAAVGVSLEDVFIDLVTEEAEETSSGADSQESEVA